MPRAVVDFVDVREETGVGVWVLVRECVGDDDGQGVLVNSFVLVPEGDEVLVLVPEGDKVLVMLRDSESVLVVVEEGVVGSSMAAPFMAYRLSSVDPTKTVPSAPIVTGDLAAVLAVKFHRRAPVSPSSAQK